jgi:hypothetical protein
MVWSSLTSVNPRSSSRSAGPTCRAGRAGDQRRAAADRDRAGVNGLRDSRGDLGARVHARSAAGMRMVKRAPDGARRGLHVNLPVMSFDNRTGDRKPEPRVAPEAFALGPY